MDKIEQCAQVFESLLYKDFYLTLENGVILRVHFDKHYFKHLLGLHKLIDLPESRESSSALFKKAYDGKLTEEYLRKSVFYPQIDSRVSTFPEVETVFDKKIVVDFNSQLVESSKLNAEYILYADYQDGRIYLAVAPSVSGDYLESFFFDRTNYYLSGQNLLDVVNLEVIERKKKPKKKKRK